MTTIIDSTPEPVASAFKSKAHEDSFRKVQAERAAFRAYQKANLEVLAKGVEVYPDSLPGVGWVLARKGHPKRYLRTKELAVAHWETLR